MILGTMIPQGKPTKRKIFILISLCDSKTVGYEKGLCDFVSPANNRWSRKNSQSPFFYVMSQFFVTLFNYYIPILYPSFHNQYILGV